eukprot:CAMPEP_0167744284 /NCGR_PEP_ID=MMETSP0110_2-20121227/2502_1 /TAXON_ID=629695 /ORGANISM="Gymnochlora sp., Strain CCMP2014" /LENGTH=94 /DNA_ID=CAMNT_0007628781 /DNA_START=288 /DNA_END=573 /DNA_ORIENTATION=-
MLTDQNDKQMVSHRSSMQGKPPGTLEELQQYSYDDDHWSWFPQMCGALRKLYYITLCTSSKRPEEVPNGMEHPTKEICEPTPHPHKEMSNGDEH